MVGEADIANHGLDKKLLIKMISILVLSFLLIHFRKREP